MKKLLLPMTFLLSGCGVGTVIGIGLDVVETAVDVTATTVGAVGGLAVDAISGGDDSVKTPTAK